MKKITSILILTCLITLLGGCKYKGQNVITGEGDKYYKAAHATGVRYINIKSGETRQGVTIYGNRDLTQTEKDTVDAALTEKFAQAQRQFPGEIMDATYDFKSWDFYVPPDSCEPSPEQKVPAFLVPGGPAYDGSQYDYFNSGNDEKTFPKEVTDANGQKKYLYHEPDGWSAIYATEYVLNMSTTTTPGRNAIMVCTDASALKEGAMNGAEHCILAGGKTDRVLKLFWDSLYHTVKGHPIFTGEMAPAGLVSQPQKVTQKMPELTQVPEPVK